MKNIIILIILLVLVVGFVYFFQGQERGILSEGVTGEVVAVDLEQMALDGPALVTIENTDGTHIIAIPSMGLPLCEAFESITPVDVIEPGDVVSVAGEIDAAGRIVPCSDVSHHLTVVSAVHDEALGYTFTYPKGPVGYVVVGDTESQDPDFVSGVALFDREEYDVFLNSTDAREGPPAMHVRVYTNTQSLHAPVWAMRHSLESNIELALGETEETVVGGANAEHYVVDGLFPIDTYVVAHGGYIYLLMGAYPDQESRIYKDFQSLVGSFMFIPTPDRV